MKQKKLIVKTSSRKYPLVIGYNLISKISKIFDENSIKFKKSLIVVDKNIPKKLLNKIKNSFRNKEIYFYFFQANEKNKNQKTINLILEILLKKNFSREDCLIAVGGGITGDITSFAASLFKRGMQFINIPSTLLSQVDSSIGGKTGINTIYGKNLIGSFYQPKLIVSDTIFLKTLSKKEVICGYAEIFKHSLISNKKFFNFLNKNFNNILNLKSPYLEKSIYESCNVKKKIVEKDENEINLRKVLNFGHTFAHAYEATMNFSKKLNHGEAVLLGINTALKLSLKIKLIKKNEYEKITNHLKNPILPSNIKKYFSIKKLDKILFFMQKDKKNNSDKINLILLKKIGSPIASNQYSKEFLKSFLKKELIN